MRWLLPFVLAVWPALALAQEDPAAVLSGLLERQDIAADRLAPAFREEVPLPALGYVLRDVTTQLGPVEDISVTDTNFTVTGADGTVRGVISLDDEGRIETLFFQPVEVASRPMDETVATLGTLGDEVSWLVRRGDETLAAQGADAALAVGSAFKLGVLAALRDEIEAGARNWSDVVQLRDRHRSLPSGDLRNWPEGAPLTLQTAATLMIAESDNTATDLLIDTLGREAVAAALGQDDVLTTREAFALMADPEAASEWRAAAPDAKAEIAAAAAETLPDALTVDTDAPIGWRLSAERLCTLMEQVGDLPLMSVNPGPVAAADGARLAYKGGELGSTFNLTARVVPVDGPPICAVLTVNGRDASRADVVDGFRNLLSAAEEAAE